MQFTKKDLALALVEDFCIENDIKQGSNLEKLAGYIVQDSRLAVALEFLGKLNGDDADYASTRAGIILSHFDNETQQLKTLTARDLFALLPE